MLRVRRTNGTEKGFCQEEKTEATKKLQLIPKQH